MKIIASPNKNSRQSTLKPVTLGDDGVGDHISDSGGGRVTFSEQIVPLPRAETPFVAERGNAIYSYSWQVERIHESPWTAFVFYLTHATETARLADVEFSDTGGALNLRGTLLTVETTRRDSQSTITRYAVKGGVYSAV